MPRYHGLSKFRLNIIFRCNVGPANRELFIELTLQHEGNLQFAAFMLARNMVNKFKLYRSKIMKIM
jgi:hypothetical protein